MTSNFFNILILLGVIQGFITAILLFGTRINKNANTILAWLILLISMACLNFYLLETVESSSSFWSVFWAIFPLIVFMPVGPLVYFYVKSILYPEFKLRKKNKAHFYSTVIDLFPYVLTAIVLFSAHFELINSKSSQLIDVFIDAYYKYSDIVRWLSLIIYLILTYKLLGAIGKTHKEKIALRWAKHFTIGFTIFSVIWLIHLIPYIIPSLSEKLMGKVGYYPIFIPLIVLIYWLGINGYIISFRTWKKSIRKIDISVDELKSTAHTLKQVMTVEKLYLNPSLKLNDVVRRLGVSQKIISAVLNQYMGKSFNEFVNGYRVEEFKRRIISDDAKELTIMGVAYECGFNSQATFQRTFKQQTGMPPREYLKKHQKSK